MKKIPVMILPSDSNIEMMHKTLAGTAISGMARKLTVTLVP